MYSQRRKNAGAEAKHSSRKTTLSRLWRVPLPRMTLAFLAILKFDLYIHGKTLVFFLTFRTHNVFSSFKLYYITCITFPCSLRIYSNILARAEASTKDSWSCHSNIIEHANRMDFKFNRLSALMPPSSLNHSAPATEHSEVHSISMCSSPWSRGAKVTIVVRAPEPHRSTDECVQVNRARAMALTCIGAS